MVLLKVLRDLFVLVMLGLGTRRLLVMSSPVRCSSEPLALGDGAVDLLVMLFRAFADLVTPGLLDLMVCIRLVVVCSPLVILVSRLYG